ncbi:MAG: LytTR family DNA-binding domain-containing protein, partial [Bacteroidota bacterium]
RTYTVSFTLNELEQRLDADRFLRIHRTYLVNVSAIRELVPWFSGTYQAKLSTGDVLPIARRRVKAVKALLRT